ncbi:MAG: class I SAM-dependent methyltransferase [Polyangiaceae bacterium]|nr:class I SAM-dependent methyltransferase [Polyangiaceae bacterium]
MAIKKKTAPRAQKKSKKKPRLTAKTADRHALYQQSVQDPKEEVRVLTRMFRKHRARAPLSLREDFCGTALLCAEWVKANPQNTATGIDIDKEVLGWGKQHNILPLGEPAERVQLLAQNVMKAVRRKHDIICGFNFSYWIFQDRPSLRNYFKTARAGLNRDGLLILDAFGGWEANQLMSEMRTVKGFKYIWDQDSFDPINGIAVNHIHFEFPDGTRLNEAFSYTWRHWTLPELQELLLEAGFSKVTVYWDVSDNDDVEDYRPRKVAENQPGWLAYIIAEP